MKRILSFIMVLVMAMTVLPIPANAYKIGDTIDHVLYTDIVTYINGFPIQSYNIGGNTAVVAEDLAKYGFDVEWISASRSLRITRNTEKAFNAAYKPSKTTNKIGSIAMPVLYTDIVTYFDGNAVPSFNINGKTVVYTDDIAKAYASDYSWVPELRELSLQLAGNITQVIEKDRWSFTYSNLDVDYGLTAVMDGFMFAFENKSGGKTADFKLSERFGEYKAIDGLRLTEQTIGFSIYQRISELGDFYGQMHKACNISSGERISPNTAERLKNLQKVLKVYINDVPVSGELSYSMGNGHADYTFIYDKKMKLSDIKTIKIVVGNPIETAEPAEIVEPTAEPAADDVFNIDKAVQLFMPKGDAELMKDIELVKKVKSAIDNAYKLNHWLIGYDFPHLGDKPYETGTEDASSVYWLADISAASGKEELRKLYTSAFTAKYLEAMEKPLDEQLFGGELPIYKIKDGKFLVLERYFGVLNEYSTDSTVIVSKTKNSLTAAVTGWNVSGARYIQTIKFVIFNDNYYIDSMETKEVFPEATLLHNLILSNLDELKEIFELPALTKNIAIIDDIVYYQADTELTLSGIEALLKSIFTESIAQGYMELYIKPAYAEKDGKLYVSSYAVPVKLGEYDIDTYQMRLSSNTECIGTVKWACGSETATLTLRFRLTDQGWRVAARIAGAG